MSSRHGPASRSSTGITGCCWPVTWAARRSRPESVPKTHLYRLTERGQLLAAAVLAARASSLKKLVGTAA
jgi:hypothetical protein